MIVFEKLKKMATDIVGFMFFAPMMFPFGVLTCLLVFVYLPLWLLGWLPNGWAP